MRIFTKFVGRAVIGGLRGWLVLSLVGAGIAPAREVAPEQKMLWSCYMICWAYSRDFHGFYDRPLERPARDGTPVRLAELQRATEAGIDAFSIDLFIGDKNALGGFGELVKLINEHHLPIQLSPMFDGLADPGLSLDEVAKKIEAWFERYGQEPCVVRTGGKPVIFTFGASSLKPAEWQTLLQRLKAKGCDGYWIGELSHYLAVGNAPDFTAARGWLDLFPAANSFNVHSAQRAKDVPRGFAKIYPTGKAYVAPVSLGYWRPEIAVYTSQRGTGLFRDTWQAVMNSGVKWVQQSTWNDFSENHHLMPSENRGTVFIELNRFLAQQWKGQTPKLEAAKLYLSHQAEVLVGEKAEFELLALLPREGLPVKARLKIFDAQKQCVQIFPEKIFDKAGLQAAEFQLAMAKLPPGRVLFAEASLENAQGKTVASITGQSMIVTAAGYCPERNFSWLHTSSGQSLRAMSCAFEFAQAPKVFSLPQSAAKPAIQVRVESAAELADVEILHDGCQVISLRRDLPQTKLASPMTWTGTLALNRRGALDWGAYTARAVTVDGQVATARPVFVERPAEAGTTLGFWTFDADSEKDVLDSSPWLHDGRLGGRPRRKPWFPNYAPDRWGGKCLQFDGVDDCVLLEGAIVPPGAFTVEGWIKPEKAAEGSGQIIFATANAAVVLSIQRDGHLQVSRKSEGKWRAVTDRAPLKTGEWQHVAVTFDGTMLRLYRNGALLGEQAAPGDGKSGQVAIGYNSVTSGSFYHGALDELRLSARALTPAEFGPHNPLKK